MTETQVESGQNLGDQETPSSETSGTDAQQTSFDVNAVVELLKSNPNFASFVDERAQRQWQSGKDRRIGKLESKVDDFGSQLARFNEWTEKGKSQEEALLLMKMEDRLADPDAPLLPQVSPTGEIGTQTQETPAKTQAILDAMGLDANDAEVTTILREETELLAQIGKFTALAEQRRQAQTVAPKPAQQMPGVGGQAVEGEDTLENLTEKLNELMREPSVNMVQIRELRKKQAEFLKPK